MPRRPTGTTHKLNIEQIPEDRGQTVLRLTGDVDLQTGPLLRRRIEATGEPGATLVLDLRMVRFMDSPGLGTIIYCDRLQRERGGRLVLRNPVGPVRELFDIAYLANLIEIE